MTRFLAVIVGRLRSFAGRCLAISTAAYVRATWRKHRSKSVPHNLPGSLAVTLTSYPARYPTLDLTIKSLLAQNMRPDHVYLWIAEGDLASLPDRIRELEADGLEIRSCKDYRSYTKIIPALISGESDFLVTADDDQYYSRDWLRELVVGYRPDRKEIVCARAHRIILDSEGLPIPYFQWESKVAAGDADVLLFPTGVGGVLYDRDCFHQDVTRSDIFTTICPTADDVWLYWMAALNGASFRKVGRQRREVTWPGSQAVALLDINRSENDVQITQMIARYGLAFTNNVD